jgi:hypothetical protein
LNIDTGPNRGPPTFAAVAIAKPLDQPATEKLEVYGGVKNVQRITSSLRFSRCSERMKNPRYSM